VGIRENSVTERKRERERRGSGVCVFGTYKNSTDNGNGERFGCERGKRIFPHLNIWKNKRNRKDGGNLRKKIHSILVKFGTFLDFRSTKKATHTKGKLDSGSISQSTLISWRGRIQEKRERKVGRLNSWDPFPALNCENIAGGAVKRDRIGYMEEAKKERTGKG